MRTRADCGVHVESKNPGSVPNRLIAEASPYLRQHALNPVEWYAWGEEALARAKAEKDIAFS